MSATTNTHFWQWAKDRGITIETLAERLGYRVSYIALILEGQMPITSKVKVRFIEAFGPQAAAEAFALAGPEPALEATDAN